ncbi:hypothetical protein [Leifsonia sp. AG29]|uniref:hypothetical protein n=1 Tax=Leifsonia sp. AG29 TaxID=2598860 RepID=UPI00131AD267|nr:hypothetical protein [Leifsonia sp. AG29]
MRTRIRVDGRGALTAATRAVRQILWAVVLILTNAGACAIIAGATGSVPLATLALTMVAHTGLGLIGSYAVHEAAHVHALGRWAPGVSGAVVTTTTLRFSVTPMGSITGKQMTLVAVAGPIAALSTGIAIWALIPSSGIQYWYWAHALFLLPIFSDGKAIIGGISRWSETIELGREGGPAGLR